MQRTGSNPFIISTAILYDVSCEAWRALTAATAPGRLCSPDTPDVLAGPSDGHIPSVFVIHSCFPIQPAHWYSSISHPQIGDFSRFLSFVLSSKDYYIVCIAFVSRHVDSSSFSKVLYLYTARLTYLSLSVLIMNNIGKIISRLCYLDCNWTNLFQKYNMSTLLWCKTHVYSDP